MSASRTTEHVMKMRTYFVAFVAALVLVPLAATAQDAVDPDYIPTESTEVEVLDTGWYGQLDLSSSVNAASNRDVIGQSNGQSWTIGFAFDGRADYLRGQHEWRNSLYLAETFTRTPAIDEFIKTADELSLESLYYYHLPGADWFGPFARFAMNTALFKGFDVRASDVSYVLTRVDGSQEVSVRDRILLTGAFAPLTLRESVGVFARPINEEAIDIDIRTGFGARETFADGELRVDEVTELDDGTTQVDLVELQSFTQAGSETALVISGSFEDGRVNYESTLDVLVPFINTLEDDNRSAGELTNIEYVFNLGFGLVDWASVDYQFKAVRVPALLDDWQRSHNLLLTFRATLVRRGQDPDEAAE